MLKVTVSAYVPSTIDSAATPVYEMFRSLFTLTAAAEEFVKVEPAAVERPTNDPAYLSVYEKTSAPSVLLSFPKFAEVIVTL